MDDSKINFSAIDFEAATGYRNSACAVAIVRVENAKIQEIFHSYIRPPNNYYSPDTIEIHGITPDITENSPPFFKVYPDIKKRINKRNVVAHNESYDRNVVLKCMEMSKIPLEDLEFSTEKWYCTNKIYKKLGHKTTKLNLLAQEYGIELIHHDPISDAKACALLFINYLKNHHGKK